MSDWVQVLLCVCEAGTIIWAVIQIKTAWVAYARAGERAEKARQTYLESPDEVEEDEADWWKEERP